MTFVYAIGQTGQLDFDIAEESETVPSDARVFATCSAESVTKTFSERTFYQMSDGEYYALQASIREASALEAKRSKLISRRLFAKMSHWLFGE